VINFEEAENRLNEGLSSELQEQVVTIEDGQCGLNEGLSSELQEQDISIEDGQCGINLHGYLARISDEEIADGAGNAIDKCI
jgi:hypothetical protein